MPQPLSWTVGHDDVTILRCAEDHLTFDKWYQQMILLLERMAGSGEFSILDNGYKHHPGVFVTEGVKGSFNAVSFSVLSDVPGEIILMHAGVRASVAEELCNKLSTLWLAVET
jgi:hypothetical protein